jgi:formyltetrahydrofolate deformylase
VAGSTRSALASADSSAPPVARLLISCEDRPGIVAAVSGFLSANGLNIIDLDQHSTDPEGGRFFMRLEFHAGHLRERPEELERRFGEVIGGPWGMDWKLRYADGLRRTAILVSRFDHALLELLWRASRGELETELALVISNHEDLRGAVDHFGVPFHHVPVEGGRAEAERRMLELLDGEVDLVVLARYMQILSGDFVSRFPNAIITIHHSFLPASAGGSPYRQAWERGVKLIGATAHYVTEELDAGPIIEQDVVRVSHRRSAGDMRDLGRDLERQVLARAVRWHLEDRILVHENRTVVFV